MKVFFNRKGRRGFRRGTQRKAYSLRPLRKTQRPLRFGSGQKIGILSFDTTSLKGGLFICSLTRTEPSLTVGLLPRLAKLGSILPDGALCARLASPHFHGNFSKENHLAERLRTYTISIAVNLVAMSANIDFVRAHIALVCRLTASVFRLRAPVFRLTASLRGKRAPGFRLSGVVSANFGLS